MRPVLSRQSTKTGVAPMWLTASAVAMKVLAGTMTSSPGRTPAAMSASLHGVGARAHADAWSQPQKCAKASSNCASSGPMV